jgi:hypothetical protein
MSLKRSLGLHKNYCRSGMINIAPCPGAPPRNICSDSLSNPIPFTEVRLARNFYRRVRRDAFKKR